MFAQPRSSDAVGNTVAAQDRLLHADRLASVGQLAAGVAHEINNPAAVVMSNLSHLSTAVAALRATLESYRAALKEADAAMAAKLRRKEEDEQLPALESDLDDAIAESLTAMRRIRDIVRNLMRFVRGPGQPDRPTDLREVAERAVVVAMNEIRHRARLVRDYHPVPTVSGDPGELEQVVVNLLLNAAQAIPEGAAESHEIRVRVAREGDEIVLEVRDDGSGIEPDVLPRIFDPFFTTKAVGQGSGLGLSLALAVVKKHGGDIDVESAPGRGTTVRVRFPASSGVPAADAPGAEAEPSPAAKPRILIVDDEALVLRAVERFLRRTYDVATATSGEEALRLLASGASFDFILCDLMMPVMTGMDLYERIVERYPQYEERIFFSTGGAFTPRTRAFVERMSDRMVEKPLAGPELAERIERLLGRKPE